MKFSVSLAAQASLHYFKIHGNGLLRAKGRYPRHGTLFNVPFDRHKNYQYVWQIFCSRFTPVKRLIFCCKNHILAKIGNKSSSNNVIRSCILEKICCIISGQLQQCIPAVAPPQEVRMSKFWIYNTCSWNNNFALAFETEVIWFINFVSNTIKFVFITEVPKYLP